MAYFITNVIKTLLRSKIARVVPTRLFATPVTVACDPPPGVSNVSCAGESRDKALVLGAYTEDDIDSPFRFTPTGERFNEKTHGRLNDLLLISGPSPRLGGVRIFYDIDSEFPVVAVVGLGAECQGYNETELIDEQKETIRVAVAKACKMLQDIRIKKISVESFGHSESAAEGAGLAVWIYQELRRTEPLLLIPQLDLYGDCDWIGWNIGLQKAAAQNLARQFMDTPANMMTPTTFAQNAVEVLCRSGVNVEVKVQGWAETQKMGAFLSVSRGSCEPPIFLELSYYGAASSEDRPVVMIGSGVTFDSGGVCMKSCSGMSNMRGSMSGAACLVAMARAISALKIPINVRGLIPLTENMPGCSAIKPGDIVRGMNGRSILIEDTDYEARLLIADSLHYSQNFWPQFVMDIGNLTSSIEESVGSAASGVFTNSDHLWRLIKLAACHTGDRVWRYPLWEHFTHQVKDSKSTDIKNRGRGNGGASCRAASFLREFVPCGAWMHMDTLGVMTANGIDHPYLRTGMSGRPTRTLIEFIAQMSCAKCD